jgi:hypothetical protein
MSSSWCRADPILIFFQTENYLLLHIRRPLWREDESVTCSAIIHWSESHRIRNHTLLSHLRLSQLGGPDPLIYIFHELGGLIIPPGSGFPFRGVLWLAELRCRYSNPPPYEILNKNALKTFSTVWTLDISWSPLCSCGADLAEHRFQQFLCYCVTVFTAPLPSNDDIFSLYYSDFQHLGQNISVF